MRFILILSLMGSIPFSIVAQSRDTQSKFPMTLDSFYLQVKFVDGKIRDYEAFRTKATWLVTDTVLYNMSEFTNIETMLMFLMHANGSIAESYLIKPMLPSDMGPKLINHRAISGQ